jgi:hypothetical protein
MLCCVKRLKIWLKHGLALAGGLTTAMWLSAAQAQVQVQSIAATGIAGTSVKLTPSSASAEWDLQALQR